MGASHDVLLTLGKKIGLKVDLTSIRPEQSLQEIGMDSMSLVKLLYALEDEFDVMLSTEEMLEINTVADLYSLLDTKLAQAGAG